MFDIFRQIFEIARDPIAELTAAARSAAGLRRKAGRLERWAIGSRSERRRKRLNDKSAQLKRQANELDERARG